MKIHLLTFFLSVSLFAGFEPGGVSFDFGRYPVRKAQKSEGVNLLRNADFSNAGTDLQGEGQTSGKRKGQFWDGCSYVHMDKTEGDSTVYRQAMIQHSRRYVEDGHATILTPPEVAKDWTERRRVSNRVRQAVDVPYSETPRSYELSFILRGQAGKVDTWNHAQIFVAARSSRVGEPNKEMGCFVNKVLPHSAEFQEQVIKFNAPAKCRSLSVDFALYGIGKMQFDDVKLQSITLSNEVEALNFPCGYFDELFCIGEKRCAPMLFALGCEGNAERKGLFFDLELPEGFFFVDTRREHPLASRQGQLWSLSLAAIPPSAIAPNFNHQWQAVTILIGTDKSAGDAEYTARYRTRGDGYETAWRHLNLKVIPTVSGKRPASFLSGAMFSTDFNYAKDADKAVQLLSEAGFNAGVTGYPPVAKLMKQLGMRRFGGAGLRNGFYVIPGQLKDDEKFRKFDGSAWEGACCPGAVIKRSESYLKNFLPAMEKLLVTGDEIDAVLSNWEPYMFDFRGCFCQECMAEFAKFANIPLQESTPQHAITTYQEQWVRFRSRRHGDMVKVLAADLAAIGAKAGKPDATFIPEMAYCSVLPSRMKDFAQYAVADYADSIPELNLWGPYVFHAPDTPYVYHPAPNLKTYTAAEQVLAGLNAICTRRPKIYAFPHGTLDNPVWFSTPEAIGFEFLCFFVQGWDGAFGYYFPRGGDARYYKALADTNTLIADHEDIRRKGTDISSQVTLAPVTPFPDHNFFDEFPGIPVELPGLSKKSLLQHRAFQLGDTRLVMAGNFWISAEVFFKLSVKGLPSSQRFDLSVPGVSCGSVTGDELSRGVLMQAGALRWQFITIKPTAAPAAPVFSQSRLEALMAQRLPGIAKAAQMVEQNYRQRQQLLKADLALVNTSQLKPLEHQGFKLLPQDQTLFLQAPGYSLRIDPGHGGRIYDWKLGDTVLIADPAPRGLGIDAFWYPAKAAKQLLHPYAITDCTPLQDGIAVQMETTITPQQIPALEGLRVSKRFEFTRDGIRLSTTLENHSDNGMDLSFRFHAMPDFLALHDGKSGTIDFGKGVTFHREFFEKMFRFAPSDPTIEKAFTMHKMQTIPSADATIQAPWTPVRLKVSLPPEQLQCIVCWDDGKDPSATFETIFRRHSIAPGEQITYTCQWTIEKVESRK